MLFNWQLHFNNVFTRAFFVKLKFPLEFSQGYLSFKDIRCQSCGSSKLNNAAVLLYTYGYFKVSR